MARFHSSKALFLFKYIQNLQLTSIFSVQFGEFWQPPTRVYPSETGSVSFTGTAPSCPASHPSEGAPARTPIATSLGWPSLLRMESHSTHLCGEGSLRLVLRFIPVTADIVRTRGPSEDGAPAWRFPLATSAFTPKMPGRAAEQERASDLVGNGLGVSRARSSSYARSAALGGRAAAHAPKLAVLGVKSSASLWV